MSKPLELQRTNPTAREAYSFQGPGTGGGGEALEKLESNCDRRIVSDSRCLDIGFGEGKLVNALLERKCKSVCGVDIAMASMLPYSSGVSVSVFFKKKIGLDLRILDVSHDPLPYKDDAFDFVFCLEAIEHMSNPYHMCAEAKRVLRHDGMFVFAFPRPEDNLGYDSGQHAHVYPSLLQQGGYEQFMTQLYFKQAFRVENGSSAWYGWRNYKGPGVVDVFEMCSGNHTAEQLFNCLEEF
jgi:SAM-dependent methyltransferase